MAANTIELPDTSKVHSTVSDILMQLHRLNEEIEGCELGRRFAYGRLGNLSDGSGFENLAEYFIIHRHTRLLQVSVFLQQLLSFLGQAAAFLSIRMHNSGIQMFFGGLNFTPNSFIRHLHCFSGLIDGSGLLDVFKDFSPPVTDDDVVVFINDPLARS